MPIFESHRYFVSTTSFFNKHHKHITGCKGEAVVLDTETHIGMCGAVILTALMPSGHAQATVCTPWQTLRCGCGRRRPSPRWGADQRQLAVLVVADKFGPGVWGQRQFAP